MRISFGVFEVIERFYNNDIDKNYLLSAYFNLYYYIEYNIVYSNSVEYSQDKTKEEKIEDLMKCKITEFGKSFYEMYS